jgi:hypothetical protein
MRRRSTDVITTPPTARVPARASRALWILCFVLLLPGLPACRASAAAQAQERDERVAQLLRGYADVFAMNIEQAGFNIVQQTQTLDVRRSTTMWKLGAIPVVRRLSRKPNRVEAFIHLWAYTLIMVDYFQSGDGQASFGSAQSIAVDTCLLLEREIERVGREIMPADKFALANMDMDEFATDNKLHLGATPRLPDVSSSSAFSWIPSLSLSGFNPFGGLDKNAEAIVYFTDKAVAAISDETEKLPWRTELLLTDLESRATTRATQENLNSISASVASAADTAGSWPEDLQHVLGATLDTIDAKQEDLRQTLQQTDDTVLSIHAALQDVDKIVGGLAETSVDLTAAGEAWRQTFHSLGLKGDLPKEPLPAGASKGPPRRPFEIRDYRDVALAVTESALELGGVIADVESLASDDAPGAPLHTLDEMARSTVDHALAQSHSLIDLITLRAMQLIGALLLAGVVYRLATARLGRPRPQGSH